MWAISQSLTSCVYRGAMSTTPTARVGSTERMPSNSPRLERWLERLAAWAASPKGGYSPADPAAARMQRIVLLQTALDDSGYEDLRDSDEDDRDWPESGEVPKFTGYLAHLELTAAEAVRLGYPKYGWRDAVTSDVRLFNQSGVPIITMRNAESGPLVLELDLRVDLEGLTPAEVEERARAFIALEAFGDDLGRMVLEDTATEEKKDPPPLLREAFETGQRVASNVAFGLIDEPGLEGVCLERLETLDLEKLGDAAPVLGAIAVLSQLRRDLTAEIEELVGQAREWGATWTDVGSVEGVAPQTAYQRWSEQGRAKHREAQRRRNT